jgi:signal peptidase I
MTDILTMIKVIIAFVMDVLETIGFMGAFFIVVYLFLLQPNQVRGNSMLPNFHDRDYIFTSKITYKLKKPERGDVVVFRSPQNPDIEYIKRIVAVGGDSILFTDCKGSSNTNCTVMVNNYPLIEKHITDQTQLFDTSSITPDLPLKIPEGQIFVMGDNRSGSLDSRVFGPISESSIVGVAFLRYLPVDKAGKINNPYN